MSTELILFGPTDRQARARATLKALAAYYYGNRQSLRDLDLTEWLFLNHNSGVGSFAGISEFSVSFRAGQRATIRCIAEVLPQCLMNRQRALAGLQWGTELLNGVSRRSCCSYDVSLFRDVYQKVYLCELADLLPMFRFGIGIEFAPESPIIKMYFDLHATKAEKRHCTLAYIINLLGEKLAIEDWKRACPEIDLDKSRVIGLDFGAGNSTRSKFYWGARHLTWRDITDASRAICGERHLATLRYLEHEIIRESESLSSVLISKCNAKGKQSMKLDICIARLYKNDGDAYDAIERFRAAITEIYVPTPVKIFTGGLEPCRTKCVQQYLSVELSSSLSPRVTIYYRPIGFETGHLNPVLLPRIHSL